MHALNWLRSFGFGNLENDVEKERTANNVKAHDAAQKLDYLYACY
jgi:hypothetical protein